MQLNKQGNSPFFVSTRHCGEIQHRLLQQRRLAHRGGILRGNGGEARHRRIHAPQQLRVDGRLEEAVEIFAVREAEEVLAVAPRYGHGEHDGVQQQVHELLVLRRGQNGVGFKQQTKTSFLLTDQIESHCGPRLDHRPELK